ncbi:hypothetical protein CLF_104033 [Clonorchis sinensis]|uniref:Uncharacterized protein n=1 Tax=Clonorchis sinensis TaxID=79923 RepID=G7YNR2_CLOSI|nr:hypothetical protein CLF_104033 [Clonorchis sinensis]
MQCYMNRIIYDGRTDFTCPSRALHKFGLYIKRLGIQKIADGYESLLAENPSIVDYLTAHRRWSVSIEMTHYLQTTCATSKNRIMQLSDEGGTNIQGFKWVEVVAHFGTTAKRHMAFRTQKITDRLQMLYRRTHARKRYPPNCALMMSPPKVTKSLKANCQARRTDQQRIKRCVAAVTKNECRARTKNSHRASRGSQGPMRWKRYLTWQFDISTSVHDLCKENLFVWF